MRSWIASVIALLFALCAVLGENDVSIVTYLGNDFILKDGCPVAACDQRNRACIARNRQIRLKYDQCVSNGDGDFHGCVTDVLQNGEKLTVPIYASFCSGFCYEKDQRQLERLEKCPIKGKKHEITPELARSL